VFSSEKSRNVSDISLEELIRVGVAAFHVPRPVDDEDVPIGFEDDIELAEVCVDNPSFEIGLAHMKENLVEHLLGVWNLHVMKEFSSFDHPRDDDMSVLLDRLGNPKFFGFRLAKGLDGDIGGGHTRRKE